MSFQDKIEKIATYALDQRRWLTTEEAAKTAIVLRVFRALGYDIHDPREFLPEFTADVGVKRGEKVDYAIFIEDKVQIIVECKSPDVNLSRVGLSQIFRYYATTDARFAILTNGYEWRFYADTETANKMDLKPFLVVDFSELTADAVEGLKRFSKECFDPDAVSRAASEAKTDRAIMREVTNELSNPSEEFVKMIAKRVHDGRLTERIVVQYQERVEQMMRHTLQEIARMRAEMLLKTVENNSSQSEKWCSVQPEQTEIVTTQEEIEGYEIARRIASTVIASNRIVLRDQKTYCSVLIDNNNRKPLLRMWFNNSDRLVIELFDGQTPEKIGISSPNDIGKFSERIRATASIYKEAAA